MLFLKQQFEQIKGNFPKFAFSEIIDVGFNKMYVTLYERNIMAKRIPGVCKLFSKLWKTK